MFVRSSSFIILFKPLISLLIFCLDVSSIAESDVLKFPTTIVELSISPFNSLNVCLILYIFGLCHFVHVCYNAFLLKLSLTIYYVLPCGYKFFIRFSIPKIGFINFYQHKIFFSEGNKSWISLFHYFCEITEPLYFFVVSIILITVASWVAKAGEVDNNINPIGYKTYGKQDGILHIHRSKKSEDGQQVWITVCVLSWLMSVSVLGARIHPYQWEIHLEKFTIWKH